MASSGVTTGEGSKTVIPAEASAKISFRLVEGQEPGKIRKAFRDYVTARLPKDCKAEFGDHSSAPAIALDWNIEAARCRKRALTEEWGKETVLMGSGASIPIVADFKQQRSVSTPCWSVWARRRQHPFSEREIRPEEFPQGHSFVGANSRRAGRRTALNRYIAYGGKGALCAVPTI